MRKSKGEPINTLRFSSHGFFFNWTWDPAGDAEEAHATDPRQEELLQHPQVREHLANVLGDHWSEWVDTKIPALGGKTPRQAVKTPAGRESVEALLLDAERDAARFPQLPEVAVEAVRNARRTLGLSTDSRR